MLCREEKWKEKKRDTARADLSHLHVNVEAVAQAAQRDKYVPRVVRVRIGRTGDYGTRYNISGMLLFFPVPSDIASRSLVSLPVKFNAGQFLLRVD